MNRLYPWRPGSSLVSLMVSLLMAVGLVLLLWVFVTPASAVTCSVPSGYATIQDAVDDASCSAINVSGGTYAERVEIRRSLVIRGAGKLTTVVDGGGAGRPFTVRGFSTVVELSDMRLTNGRALPAPRYGGGLLVTEGATVSGQNLQIDNNVASGDIGTGYGGGLAVWNGSAFIIGTSVLSNTALTQGAGDGFGGGLFAGGTEEGPSRAVLHLTGSEVRGNVAYASTLASPNQTYDAFGGGLYVGASTETDIRLQGNTWENNIARRAVAFSGNGDGGAIAFDTGDTRALLTITGDEFRNNVANATSNTAANAFARGGAIFLNTDRPRTLVARMEDTTFTGNIAKSQNTGDGAGQGGAVYARNSIVSITEGSLSENVASVTTRPNNRGIGGAVALFNSSFKGKKLTVVDNIALRGNGSDSSGADSQGGAFALNEATYAYLKNSIIADNDVSNSGGNGAGLYVSSGSELRLMHVTIADEDVNAQEGIFADTGGSVNDIVLGNSMIVSHTTGIANQGGPSRVVLQRNLFFGNTSNLVGADFGDSIEGDPDFLDPAGRSYRIGTESAAIDNGSLSRLGMDISNEERPQGSGYDIGADEIPFPIPVAQVEISGPTEGPVGDYAFAGSTEPVNATDITYDWDNGDSEVVSLRTLALTEVYTLTLGVSNADGAGSANISHTVTITDAAENCPVPLAGVTISGDVPADGGLTGEEYTFEATLNPVDATTPLTYTWVPEPMEGQGTNTAVYTWTTAGDKGVGVTAQNCGGSVAATQEATITRAPAPDIIDLLVDFFFYPLLE